MVQLCFIPSNCDNVVHSLDVNCVPLSEEISDGKPNRDTQSLTIARAHVLAVVSSGQRVKRSTTVKK